VPWAKNIIHFLQKKAEPRDNNKLRTTLSILWLSNISLDSDCIICRAVGCIGGQQTSMWRSKEQKEMNTIDKRAVKRPFGGLPRHGPSKNAAQDPDLGFERTSKITKIHFQMTAGVEIDSCAARYLEFLSIMARSHKGSID
jgi:hypothetical protein